MSFPAIEQTTREIIQTLPESVTLVAAAKTRSAGEVRAAIRGGVKILGYNYVQEAAQIAQEIDANPAVKWHLIGHLQRNKAKQAVGLFDMIETIDSLELAEIVNRHCAESGKQMPVLIEINSGREANKSGVFPENAEKLIRKISELPLVKINGLMTLAPFFDDPEKTRPYFRETRELFDQLESLCLSNVTFKFLSMGMSDTYPIAIEEGANIVRIGTKLFGPRKHSTTN
jgi:pyridoxal phosphate enzyme (YggS family)